MKFNINATTNKSRQEKALIASNVFINKLFNYNTHETNIISSFAYAFNIF